MSTTPLLQVENLSIEFGSGSAAVKAVRNVSWSIAPGETLAIIGESGSGKSVSSSTILNLLPMPPARITSGRIMFDGIDLLKINARQRREINGKRISMIFQDPLSSLNPLHTVGRHITEAMTAHGVDSASARTRALDLLTRVGIPSPETRFDDYPHQFSGGQRQRIMIAVAIAMGPELLVADEPTSALDITVQAEILQLLRSLQKETGMAIAIITHDINVARQFADKVAVMHRGEVVEAGLTSVVLTNPTNDYARRLIAAVPDHTEAIVSYHRPADGEPMCKVTKLTKIYPARKNFFGRRVSADKIAVKDVSLDIYPDEIVCVVGETGSGKSTLVRSILLLEKADAGAVVIGGKNLMDMDAAALRGMRRDMQIIFQDPTASLNPQLTVEGIICEPWNIHQDVVAPADRRRQAGDLLERVGLKREQLDLHPHQFSGGQRQRIAIARALALRPQLIVCDEAVSALDVSVRAQILDLLAELKAATGMSLLFITHDLSLVRQFANRVIVMRNGEIVEMGNVQDVFLAPAHDYTKSLLGSLERLIE
ncbi:ABC transporter ATP-binding protein [Devosia limi DSM 17137]|uniref:ABC transporter ATP-binding protein n=1 Tax=Devosia limi DSM 17137 TaxID=1121477 RepID=A0A0F5LPY7_9HYPH|nr:ABC transporter ATP-binding protein [Devosia limi]KKB84430.1 ABC transporter ATP-binding protein [Devosia limi DSM 17137]SHF60253.1 peptide/nickel transport system ATP-binding protein [Devosia limi DSM 17137]